MKSEVRVVPLDWPINGFQRRHEAMASHYHHPPKWQPTPYCGAADRLSDRTPEQLQ